MPTAQARDAAGNGLVHSLWTHGTRGGTVLRDQAHGGLAAAGIKTDPRSVTIFYITLQDVLLLLSSFSHDDSCSAYYPSPRERLRLV